MVLPVLESYWELEQMTGERGATVDHATIYRRLQHYAAAFAELKKESKPTETLHRQVKYLNNLIEADHGKLKQLIRPARGLKTLKTAYATIRDFEVMRTPRKGHASAFNITNDIAGEARIVERAFGLGASAPAEAV